MKTLLLALLLSCLTMTGQANSTWFNTEKALYIGGGYAVGATTYTLFYSLTNDKTTALWYGIGASTILSIGVEAYRWHIQLQPFDTKNVAAAVLGGVLGSVSFKIVIGTKRQQPGFRRFL